MKTQNAILESLKRYGKVSIDTMADGKRKWDAAIDMITAGTVKIISSGSHVSWKRGHKVTSHFVVITNN